MASWGEKLAVMAAVLIGALVAATGLVFLVGLMADPGFRPRLSYVEGAVPEDKPTYECSKWREPGIPCEIERDFRWRLPAGGTVRTTWSTSRRTTDKVGGVLTVADCPGARVSWTLTAAGHISSGQLPAVYPDGILQKELTGRQDRITLEFRRTDDVRCDAAVGWSLARLEAPSLVWLWNWW